MKRYVILLVVATIYFSKVVHCDDKKLLEAERLRNTPPELSSAGEASPTPAGSQVQARFIPFSASFSVSAGGNNAQTFSIAGSPEGIGLSQSASHSGGSAGNGNPGSFSSSQSSSIAAGLNGISTSDSNSFAANHPLYGPQSTANGNSFALGQAAASSHGDVVNGQAISGAQSSVGGAHSQASSGASSGAQNLIQLRPDRPAWGNAQPNYASGNNGDYYYNSRRPPSLSITVSDDRHRFNPKPSNGWYEVPDSRDPWRDSDYCNYYNGWYRDPRCRSPKVTVTKPGQNRPGYYPNPGPYYQNIRDPRDQTPSLQISSASAGSSAQSGPGGLAIGQSSAQSNHHSNRGPSITTTNHAQSSSNAQAQAHGAGSSINFNQNPNKPQVSFASSAASANSRPGGFSQGNSHSSSSGTSSSQVIASGGASAHSNANAGTVVFPGPSSQSQIIPQEFIRSSKKMKDDNSNPLEELITDLSDTVYEIFEY